MVETEYIKHNQEKPQLWCKIFVSVLQERLAPGWAWQWPPLSSCSWSQNDEDNMTQGPAPPLITSLTHWAQMLMELDPKQTHTLTETQH